MNRKFDLLTTVLLSITCICFALVSLPSYGQDADSSAIHKQAEQYEKAFESKDVGSILGLWLEDGCYTGPYGRSAEGRASIKQVYEEFFENLGDARIKLTINSVKKLGEGIAIEKGTIKNTSVPNRETYYTVIHAKKNGSWKIASVVERLKLSDGACIKDLFWMAGDWKAKGPDGEASIKTKVTGNKNFILNKFEIKTADGGAHSDLQIIGLDPASGGITSWSFDSDGGVGRGFWFKDGRAWVVETVRYGADGTRILATQLLSRIGDDGYTWKAIERAVDGVAVPDKSEVKIERVK